MLKVCSRLRSQPVIDRDRIRWARDGKQVTQPTNQTPPLAANTQGQETLRRAREAPRLRTSLLSSLLPTQVAVWTPVAPQLPEAWPWPSAPTLLPAFLCLPGGHCVTHWIAYLESQNTAIDTPVANTDIEIISA